MCIYIYIYIYIYMHEHDAIQGHVLKWILISLHLVFLLQVWLPQQDLRDLFSILFK